MAYSDSLPEVSFNDLFNNLPPAPQNKNDIVVLGERRYKLNNSKSKHVSTGLSRDLNYNPCVKLSGNKNDVIIFDEKEWLNFLTYQGVVTNYLYTNDRVQTIDTGNFIIKFEQISYSRVIKIIKNNSYIYFGYESICRLWEALPLVKTNIDILKRLRFQSYIKDLVEELKHKEGNIFENAAYFIEISKNCDNENIRILMELVYIYPEVFEAECRSV